MSSAPALLLLLVLVGLVVLAVVAVVALRRGSARREQQRVEAAGLRSEADAIAATLPGQAAFAQQAGERAELARVEAEAKAREAARLEAEAHAQHEAAEATRREYEATMRRADDIDPDVKESAFAPVTDEPSTDAVAEPPSDAVAEPSADAVAEPSADDDLPPTRAERRAAQDAAQAGGGEGDPRSERIASAADYRDEVPATSGPADEVYPGAAVGSGVLMSEDSSPRTAPDAADEEAGTTRTRDEHALSQDAETPAGEWGGPREGATDAGEVEMVTDLEHYASAEPLLADGTTAPAATENVTGDATAGDDEAVRRDWAADEGERLAETHDRGDRLEQDRADLEQDDAGLERDSTDRGQDHADREQDSTDLGQDRTGLEEATEAPAGATASGGDSGRRISDFTELRDGGFGVGSAAPIEGGAQPLDHPVQAYRDTMTFRVPGDPGYDSSEPDVWFYDEGAAERSGFRRSQG
ncbi:hypothetical protein GCM10023168_37400 [Fodinibacter luteus]|uniref:Uncharacterized protein n=1 Tax=Fodinibacter luteus TaxID=552064 RepID=A0ABP8KSR2_9MICO